tara:strand:+ start:253 stop:1152 length:900 start_codon:yes stop_codon:yes gene_type:complete
MKLLITGKNGQVGNELAKQVINYNFKTFFFDKKELNICNYKNLKKIIYSLKPDVVINLAAYTSVKNAEENRDECFHVNADGVLNLTNLCKEKSILLIHISSDYVFDGLKRSEYLEIDKANPLNTYGYSKREGEKKIIENLKTYIIIRTSWVFSTYGNNFVKNIINLLKGKKNLSVVGSQIGGPTFAKNLAHVIILFCIKYSKEKKLDYGIFHYSNQPFVSWLNFAEEIVKNIRLNKYLDLDDKFILSERISNNKEIHRPNNSRLSNKKINDYLKIDTKEWLPGLDECLRELKKDKFYEN